MVTNKTAVRVTCFVTQALMGFAVLRHAKVNGFQGRILIFSQVQEVLRLHIANEDIAGMALGHRPQDLTHRLGGICTAQAA